MHIINKVLSKMDLAIILRSRIDNVEKENKKLKQQLRNLNGVKKAVANKEKESLKLKEEIAALSEKLPALEVADSGVLKIAIDLNSNGLGDSIISLAWIKELYMQIPYPLEIDLYGKEKNLSFLTNLYSFINGIYPAKLFNNATGYDIKLHLHYHVLLISYAPASIAKKFPGMIDIINKLNEYNSEYKKYIDTKYLHAAWVQVCNFFNWNRWDSLGSNNCIDFNRHSVGLFHIHMEAISCLKKFDLHKKKYITIHRGIDAQHRARKTSNVWMKVWPDKNAEDFCALFKQQYPDIEIVQLGTDEHLSIQSVDKNLIGKTTLEELAVILKNSLLHIDGESGLVHLNALLQGKSVVLFGPTSSKYFGYEQNINIKSPFCGECMWLKGGPEWISICLQGYKEPECMRQITADMVFDAIKNEIDCKRSDQFKYTLEDLSLYTTEGKNTYLPLLHDLGRVCNIVIPPITRHAYGEARTYIHASKQWEYPYALDHIAKKGGSSLKIADVGGGRGALSCYLARMGHDVSLYDINYTWDSGDNKHIETDFLQFARRNNFRAKFGSVFNIPEPDNTFDVVCSISVVEHVVEKFYALKELLRVLRPGGILILTYDIVISDNIDKGSMRREIFTPDILKDVLRELNINNIQTHTENSVLKSIEDVKNDKLRVAAKDLTFGALVIQKHLSGR